MKRSSLFLFSNACKMEVSGSIFLIEIFYHLSKILPYEKQP